MRGIFTIVFLLLWSLPSYAAGLTRSWGAPITNADGTLIWAEKLGSTFTPANNGDTVKITPKIQASKGTPS